MKRKVHTLAFLMSPAHAVSLQAALLALFPDQRVICETIVFWPHLPEVRQELVEVFRKILLDSKHEFRVVESFDHVRREDLKGITHFFYPHDVNENYVQEIARSIPKAKRVCTGDGLGLVCDREYHLGLVLNGRKQTMHRLRFERFHRLFKRIFLRRKVENDHSLIPDMAALILPVDQTGYSLSGVKLVVPDKERVLQLLRELLYSFSDLKAFIATLKQDPTPITVLLTENHTECGMISIEKEIEMYATMIRTFVLRGTRVLLKGHPGEKLDRYKALKERLGDDYELLETPPQFKRIPFEIWVDLIPHADIVCGSYPTLSLRYLFEKKVINPITNDFIETWFDPRLWDTYKNAGALYDVPLSNLPTWDGKSLLAKGPF